MLALRIEAYWEEVSEGGKSDWGKGAGGKANFGKGGKSDWGKGGGGDQDQRGKANLGKGGKSNWDKGGGGDQGKGGKSDWGEGKGGDPSGGKGQPTSFNPGIRLLKNSLDFYETACGEGFACQANLRLSLVLKTDARASFRMHSSMQQAPSKDLIAERIAIPLGGKSVAASYLSNSVGSTSQDHLTLGRQTLLVTQCCTTLSLVLLFSEPERFFVWYAASLQLFVVFLGASQDGRERGGNHGGGSGSAPSCCMLIDVD